MKTLCKGAVNTVLALALGLAAAAATAQTATGAPALALDTPLKLIVGYAPGGASDRAARLLGEALQQRHGITVIVENKPGAGGRLAAQQFKLLEASDNALMLGNPAVITVAPLVFKDNRYDPEADFVPVSQVTTYDFGIAVGGQVPVRELSHLFAWLRANPEKAFFGVPATGSLPHFFGLMLSDRAQVKGEVVGYKGSAPLTTDLVGGQVPLGVDTVDSLAALHEGGKLKLLATSGERRSPFSPQVPTLKEAGVDLAATGWNVLFAPKAMPPAKVVALAQAVQAAMADPAVRQRFVEAKMEPVSASQAQTARMIQAYKAQWAPVVQRSGYQP